MVKKNKPAKKRKIAKLTDEEKEELKLEGELPKRSIRESENRQLLWFFIIVGIVFVIVLVSYFWIEGSKEFEYGGAEWLIEDYPNLRIYHGRFMALDGADLYYNIFLRNDPRKENVPTEGTFDKFRYGGIVSFDPDVEKCKGELSRAMLDLGGFLKQGLGVGSLEVGSTDETVAIDNDRRFARCDTISDRTLVVVKFGDSSVVQDEDNPYCYVINIEDCNDISSIERFMVKSIGDFTDAKKALEESKKVA